MEKYIGGGDVDGVVVVGECEVMVGVGGIVVCYVEIVVIEDEVGSVCGGSVDGVGGVVVGEGFEGEEVVVDGDGIGEVVECVECECVGVGFGKVGGVGD